MKVLYRQYFVNFLNHTAKLGEEFILPFSPLPCIYLNLLFHSFSKCLLAFLTIKEQDKNLKSTDEGKKIYHIRKKPRLKALKYKALNSEQGVYSKIPESNWVCCVCSPLQPIS